MALINCSCCGEMREGLGRAPLPGKVGQEIEANTCRDCWQQWMGELTKLINERSLTPINPEHNKIIVAEMRRFLALGDQTMVDAVRTSGFNQRLAAEIDAFRDQGVYKRLN